MKLVNEAEVSLSTQDKRSLYIPVDFHYSLSPGSHDKHPVWSKSLREKMPSNCAVIRTSDILLLSNMFNCYLEFRQTLMLLFPFVHH